MKKGKKFIVTVRTKEKCIAFWKKARHCNQAWVRAFFVAKANGSFRSKLKF
jgi:hypothetical protein